MECPSCKEVMIILEQNQVEIDYCPGCEGIWLDAGELELLTGNTISTESIFTSPSNKEIENNRKLKCPRCNKKMDKVVTKENVIIDKCLKNHGYWFDNGELLEIISVNNKGENNPVLTFLKDIFNS